MSKTAVQFRHNGNDVAVFVDGGANLLTTLRAGIRRHRAEIRLRAGHLRCMHRARSTVSRI